MVTISEISQILEELAPVALAAEWDRVGLQLGDPGALVERVLLALDLTDGVLAQVREGKANLLVLHHPLFFRPWGELRWDRAAGRRVRELVCLNCGVLVAHTNWDAATHGLNHHLASLLGLEKVEPLEMTGAKLYKLVTFVPQAHWEGVREALAEAGAGWIGNYSHCSFGTSGTGTFLPREGTNPFIGQEGHLEKVAEVRLETVVPANRLDRAIAAMSSAHPYEEVAYDVYPLVNKGPGIGRVGNLPQECTLGELAQGVGRKLGTGGVRLSGDPTRLVERVAVVGGAGGELGTAAAGKGAEVLVTGEARYHQVMEAMDAGVAVIEAGHYATEVFSLPFLAEALGARLGEAVGVEVVREADAGRWIRC